MAPANIVILLTSVVVLKIAGEYMLHGRGGGATHHLSPPNPVPPSNSEAYWKPLTMRSPHMRPTSNITTPGVDVQLDPIGEKDAKVDVVLSCFYFRKGWYLTRAIPPLEWAKVFIRSLYTHRKTATNSGRSLKLVIWVDMATGKALQEDIDKMNISSPVDFITLIPFNWETRFPNMRWANLTLLRNSAGSFRYDLYRVYLEQQKEGINRVLMSDLTDVAFQGNPFDTCFPEGSNLAEPKMLFTYESWKKNFGNEVHNRRWMRCYPKHVLHALRHSQIGNSGVTFGTISGMIQYTHLIMEQIVALTDCCVNVIKTSNDQASLNYLLHYVQHDKAVWDPAAIPMTHPCVFHGNFASLRIDGDKVVSPDGRPYSIVHQFTSDRHPPAMKLLKSIYGE
eukprot:TRINITY_DN10659_c0_g1_i1.p1 TRINITY_DN10659_c0_g1~~TRINITY_DN10659_c0_g1_i1.p1  ORF type:complete len:394 (+),score=33.66 TRINITY_DN10659_c0_g1_i1:105-1286(+)